MNKYSKKVNGYSLIEVLMAIGVFSLLAVLVTQILATTLRSAKKSDSASRVRTNFDYAISIMERQLRNSASITSFCTSNISKLEYRDSNINPAYFECVTEDGTLAYVASGSADHIDRLTSEDVNMTACSFNCTAISGVPDSIDISLSGYDNKSSGVESTRVTVQTRVMLRSY